MNWKERAENVWAQGHPSTNSKRRTAYVEGIYPEAISHGEGCYLYDATGKRFVDFVGGLGTNILGYGFPKVMEAVYAQLKRGGPSYSLPHYIEYEVAELIQEIIPGMERVRFLKTGSEATCAAVRIARTYTNKPSIYSVDYHGHSDLWTSMTPPSMGVFDKFDVYQDDGIRDGTAAFICEPITTDASEDQKNWLGTWRDVTSERKAVLIFDEIVTGFRVPKYTVSQWWEIQPDITCLGKAIANGFPLAVVGGKKEVMNCGEYFISSTYGGEAMSLAAAKATIEELKKRNMGDLFFYANRFQDNLNKITNEIGVKFEGYGTRAMLNVEEFNTALFMQECCKAGVIFGKAHFYGFAHLEAEIETQVLSLVHDAVARIKQGKVKLEGVRPAVTFKR